ncbi:MAG: flavodoxin family protein [Lentisphaeraceae bacterium]|nr:flavodoxin family protein [Lentisphaeraceae bacterium]
MAELVPEGCHELDCMTVRVLSTEEASADDLNWCDGIAVGSPTNYGTVSGEMKTWWDKLPPEGWGKNDGKIGCAFSSSAAWGGGSELTCMTILTILMNYGLLTFGVTDYVDKQFSPHYGSVCAGEPREERVKKSCRRLGRRLAEWCACLIKGRRDMHPLKQDYDRFDNLG